ncbi:MAG: ribosome-associated translation inhibitor RaiA [Planctomycetota bacterium]
MEIKLIGRHLELTDAIREHATQRAERLPRLFDRVRETDVVIDRLDARRFGVEFVVHVDRHDPIVATATDPDLHACLDATVAKVERQLHDLKQRLRNRKHPAST